MSGIETKQSNENPREKLRRETNETLNWLKNKVKLNNDLWITKQPTLENWAAVFGYKYMWWKWEIVTRKESNGKYSVRIKKWLKLPNWKEWWQTQKNGSNETFPIIANDKLTFNRKLWVALDTIIWKNRDRLPTTGWKVYDLLNPDKSTPKKPEWKSESTEKRNSKFDTRYEKQYWVKLIRDKSLNFYVVKKWEWLSTIREKLKKIPEFSYLASPYYDPSNPKNKTHAFNTPNTSLKEGFYLPIPIKKEQREVSISNFKSKATKALNEMKNNRAYWEKIKNLVRNLGEKEVVNIMAAYARSETAEDYTKFSDPIWSVELHRWEKRYTAYSFSYFHILMEKTADRKSAWPWLRARLNLWLSEWDCYNVENACKLFLWYCFEKSKEFWLRDDYFFKIRSRNEALKVGKTYNWDSTYGNKLWANIQHCKTVK